MIEIYLICELIDDNLKVLDKAFSFDKLDEIMEKYRSFGKRVIAIRAFC